MSRMLRTAGTAALFAVGVVACSSQSITDTALGFTIEEGLLLVDSTDPTVGTVVLTTGVNTCPFFQAGARFTQIGSTDFLTFGLNVLVADGGYLPLTAGTYNIVIPGQLPVGAEGLYATSTEYEIHLDCTSFSATGANSGTVTVQPLEPDAGGVSQVSYSVVFGYARFSAAYPIATCVVPHGVTPDAGPSNCF